ncbi:H+ Antiporter protein [compost metagenome]
MSHTSFRESITLLYTRRFGTFWFASLLSNIGTWAQQVAQPWLLLSLGASPFVIGLDSFALSAPVWFLTLVGGALADRADRRRVIATFQSIQMLCPIMLVVLLLLGMVQPWMVIVLSLVVGITDAMSMPSFQSIVPSIVERKQIASGLALNSTQFNLSRILGPAIAGVLLASVGAIGCFAVSAVSYIPFILVALWILPHAKIVAAAGGATNRHTLVAHVRELVRIPYLRGALLTVFTSSLLCAQLVTFSPVLIKDVFKGDASQFSIAVGAFGVGGLLGATLLLFVDARHDRRRISSYFAGAYGLVLLLAAINPWFWGLPALLVAAGLSMSVSNISANTLLLSTTTPQLRGQAVSLFMLAMRGGLSIGSLVTGITVSTLGVSEALLLNGLLAVLAQVFVARYWLASALPPAMLENP